MNNRLQQKGFGIVEVIFIIIIVGIIGALGFVFWQQNMKGDESSSSLPSKTNESAQELQPSEVTKKIKDTLAEKYTLLDLDQNNQPKEGELSVRTGNDSPVWKVDGYNFYVDYEGGSSIDAVSSDSISTELPSAESKVIRSITAQTYKEYGLVKSGTHGGDEFSATEVYTGKGLVCTMESIGSQTSSNQAACGVIAEYKDAAKRAKPLFDVLPNKSSDTALVNIEIKASLVAGYQKAQAGVGSINGFGGFAGFFYKKDGGSWAYFAGTQEIIDCTKYNTDDTRNAFMGDACYDYTTDRESTVR